MKRLISVIGTITLLFTILDVHAQNYVWTALFDSPGTPTYRSLRDVALSPDGTVVYVGWIQGSSTRRMQSYRTDNNAFLGETPASGNPVNSIAVDDRGNIFTVSFSTQPIARWTGGTIATPNFTLVNTFPAVASEHSGVAVWKDGTNYFLYVTYASNIVRWNINDPSHPSVDTNWATNGTFTINENTNLPLRDLTVANDGTIYVTKRNDSGNNTVWRITSGLTPSVSHQTNLVIRAMDAVLHNGTLYVTSYNGTSSQIVPLNPADLLPAGTAFTATGTFTRNNTEGYSGIDIDANGRIFVCDQIYQSNRDRLLVGTSPGITITESSGSTDVTEDGATDTYTVVLNTIPTNAVTITATPDAQCDLGSGAGMAISLNFAADNTALTAQTVTVTAVDDAVVEGPHTCTITHTSSSSDTNYNNPNPIFTPNDTVIANITDNDIPPPPPPPTVRVAAGSYNGDTRRDLLFRENAKQLRMWIMSGASVLSNILINPSTLTATKEIQGVGDLNGDGRADLLVRDTVTGSVQAYIMNGASVLAQPLLSQQPADLTVAIVGLGDFNGDGRADILLREANGTGALRMFIMTGASVLANVALATVPASTTVVEGIGDFNGDGRADILLRDDNGTGALRIYVMTGASVLSNVVLGTVPAADQRVQGVGDFNGDGRADILLRANNGTGALQLFVMSGASILSQPAVTPNPVLASDTIIHGVGDLNGDGRADIIARDTNGTGPMRVLIMTGASVLSQIVIGTAIPPMTIAPR